MTTNRLDIDLNKYCKKCGAKGATPSGYCISCAADAILAGQSDPTAQVEPDFNGDWAEADPSVITIARQLIAKYHPWLRHARIGFLFRKEAPQKDGAYTLGHAEKTSARLLPFLEYDFVIWIAKDQWDRMESSRREALVDHELCHCTHGDNGWKTRGHTINEFPEIIERHGFWTHELMQVERIARQENLPGFEPGGGVGTVSVRQFAIMNEVDE